LLSSISILSSCVLSDSSDSELSLADDSTSIAASDSICETCFVKYWVIGKEPLDAFVYKPEGPCFR
jgi:hypothetical protein